ncbi:MAG TPA: T9SS type A sorting domain-containing protein [Bacteroidia bacterium]|nr:T9SS type A sorting domain-containing protein [Bacteroidia bacterium]
MKTKMLLLIVFIFSVWFSVIGQSTWIYNLSSCNGGIYSLVNDYVAGIRDAAIGADGSLYLLTKKWDGDYYFIQKYDLATDTVVWEIYNLNDPPTRIKATPDSGCIFFTNHWSFPNNMTEIKKYNKNGLPGWTVQLGYLFNGGHWTWDVIPNNAGNYFALVYSFPPGVDSLFEYNNLGIAVDSLAMPAQGGRSLFQMPNNDLIVQFPTNLLRMDLSGSAVWNFPGQVDLISYDTSAIFVCDTNNSFSVIKKINPLNGALVWTDTINQPAITSIDATSDGGVIISTGIPLTYYSTSTPPPHMSGELIKLDSNGNVQWDKTYLFNEYGLSYVKELNPGNFLTSGTYMSSRLDCPSCLATPCALIATADSAGNSILETISYMWPGDANHDTIMNASADILYTVMALGHTGPVRNIAFDGTMVPSELSAYAFDWPSSFPNGVNVKHADFDNSGIVDTADVNIYMRYHQLWCGCDLSWRSSQQLFSTQPDFIIQPEKDSVAPGDIMRFYVIAGSASLPVDSVYGIAFFAFYDYWNTNMSPSNFTLYNSDFGTLGANLYAGGSDTGMCGIRMAFCRTDSVNVYQLYDTLGVIEITSNSAITLPVSFAIQIASFYSMTLSTSQVNFNLVSNPVVIDPALVSVNEHQNADVTIFPNPANKFLMLDNLEEGKKELCIYNLRGQKIKTLVSYERSFRMPVNDLENGVYTLLVSSNDEKVYKKFSVNH